ncbi:LuxR C-terminal-related transcriptional regulator [Chloroflexota bacterium]
MNSKRLNIPFKTVLRKRANIMRKLGVYNDVELIM